MPRPAPSSGSSRNGRASFSSPKSTIPSLPSRSRPCARSNEALSRVPRVAPVSALTIAGRLRPGLSPDAEGRGALRRFLTGTSFFRRQALVGDRFLGLALHPGRQRPAGARPGPGRDRAGDRGDAGPDRIPPRAPLGRALRRRLPRGPDARRERPLLSALRRLRRGLEPPSLPVGAGPRRDPAHPGRLRPAGHFRGRALRLLLFHRLLARAPHPHDHEQRLLDLPPLPVRGSALRRSPSTSTRSSPWPTSSSRCRCRSPPPRWASPPSRSPRSARCARWGFGPRRGSCSSVSSRSRSSPRCKGSCALPPARAPAGRRLGGARRRRHPRLVLSLALAAGPHRRRAQPGRGGGGLRLAGPLRPMPLETDSLDYVSPRLALYQDTRAFERDVSGLTRFALWITTPPGAVVDPSFLAGLERFATALEGQPGVGAGDRPALLPPSPPLRGRSARVVPRRTRGPCPRRDRGSSSYSSVSRRSAPTSTWAPWLRPASTC